MTSRRSLPGGKTAPARCRCRASEICQERRRRQHGFTLIELLVVLAIIGMALAVTAPLLFGHGGGVTLDAASAEIRAALRGARSTAIAESRPVAFRPDTAGGYWLDRRHVALAPMSGGDPVRVATLGGTQILFYPSGGSTGGRVVVASGSAQREIVVDTLTGRADAR
jgi:general secretion pathway protein H